MNRRHPSFDHPCTSTPAAERPLRRFVPIRGQLLTMAQIRGPWRPSAAVAGAGVFSVVWEMRTCTFWAPLHDFTPSDQLRLIEACRWADRQAGYPGAWPDGRAGD